MSGKSLSPTEKAALLILSLGEDIGAQIFSKLERGQAQRIAQRLHDMGRVEQTQVDAVLKEFLELLHSPQSKLDDPQDLAQRLARRSLQGPASEQLLANMQHVRMRIFERTTMDVLGRILINEQPQTVALVMAHAPAPQSGQLLKQFPENVRIEILLRVARLQTVDPEILHDIDDHLIEEAARMGNAKQKIGGTRKVAELLNSLDQDGLAILKKLEERDPQLMDSIREEMFTFDDLQKIEGSGIREILKVAKRETLMMALRGAPAALFKLMQTNMSERAAKMFQDDFEALGPQKASDVKTARQTILELVRKLAEEGKVVLDADQRKVV